MAKTTEFNDGWHEEGEITPVPIAGKTVQSAEFSQDRVTIRFADGSSFVVREMGQVGYMSALLTEL